MFFWFFRAFNWALSIEEERLSAATEEEELPEDSGEFLDAWLTLVEKMVNCKNILESPHAVVNKSKTTGPPFNFNPTQYLISTQKVNIDKSFFNYHSHQTFFSAIFFVILNNGWWKRHVRLSYYVKDAVQFSVLQFTYNLFNLCYL